MLTELHSVDDSLSIKTLTSFWDPNGHPGPELTSTIQWGVAIEIERAIKKSARFC